MHHFIDRRRNPTGKSLSNRQKLMRRARHYIKQTIDNSVANKSIRDSKDDPDLGHEAVTIPVNGITEPRFAHSSFGGLRQKISLDNKDFVTGFPGWTQKSAKRNRNPWKMGRGKTSFLSRSPATNIWISCLEGSSCRI